MNKKTVYALLAVLLVVIACAGGATAYLNWADEQERIKAAEEATRQAEALEQAKKDWKAELVVTLDVRDWDEYSNEKAVVRVLDADGTETFYLAPVTGSTSEPIAYLPEGGHTVTAYPPILSDGSICKFGPIVHITSLAFDSEHFLNNGSYEKTVNVEGSFEILRSNLANEQKIVSDAALYKKIDPELGAALEQKALEKLERDNKDQR